MVFPWTSIMGCLVAKFVLVILQGANAFIANALWKDLLEIEQVGLKGYFGEDDIYGRVEDQGTQ
ncbi:hypothetical protein [Sediminicola arcticus]|uniref:Uncharacterized protein n=1 Tax=Sediminicola arcticus TaxID=1574308 RepID=A0ABV2SPS8_9FLAO